MRKQKSKGREWEKDRRDKLNNAFTILSKLLPCYDPSRTLSKIDILNQATVFIEELQTKIKELRNGEHARANELSEIQSLTERIKKLLTRNGELCNLLKDAGIKIPKEYGPVKNFNRKYRWSNKITPEQAKKLSKKELQKEKENEETKGHQKKTPVKKRATPLKSQKRQRVFKKRLEDKMVNSKQNTPIQIPFLNSIPGQNIALNPNYMIANPPPINIMNTGTIAKTDITLSTSTKVTKKSKTLPKSLKDKVLNILGPGTLILANGNVVPILPPPQKILQSAAILTNTAPIIVNQPKTSIAPTVIVVTSSKSENTNFLASVPSKPDISKSTMTSGINIGGKTLAPLRPKRCITKTTQINKVPIPALTSRYSKLNIVKQEIQKKNAVAAVTNLSNMKKENKTDNNSNVSNETKGCTSNVEDLKRVASPNEKGMEKRKHDDETEINERKRFKVDEGVEEAPRSVAVQENVACEIMNNEGESSLVNNDGNNKECGESHENVDRVETEQSSSNKNCLVTPESVQNDILAISEEKTSVITPTLEDNNIIDKNAVPLPNENVSNQNDVNSHPEVRNANLEVGNTVSQVENHICKSQIETANVASAEIPSGNTEIEVQVPVEQEAITKSTEEKSKVKPEKKSDSSCNLQSEIDNSRLPNNPNKIQEAVENKSIEESNNRALELGASLYHSELSNDIFSSLQVPLGSQNQESTSPTAAFLLAFPLVSTLTGVKVTEVIDEDNSDSRHGTPTLLQIGTMDSTKTTQTVPTESLTPSLLNLDNFSFFSTKDTCSSFYSSFDSLTYTTCQSTITYSSFSTTSTVTSTAPIPSTDAHIKEIVQKVKENSTEKASLKEKESKEKVAVTEGEYCITLKNHSSEKNIDSNTAICSTQVPNTNVLPICSNQVTNSNTSVIYSTSYHGFPYSNESKCKPKLDTSAKSNPNPNPNPITSSYTQENFNQISYSNTDLSLPSKQHIPSSAPAVTSHINCNFSDKLKSQPQTSYNPNLIPATSMQCNTFNPFADKLPSDYNASFTRTYGNTLYTNNNPSYTNAYQGESNSYMHGYSSIKTVPKTIANSYDQQNYSTECKSSDIPKRDHIHSSNSNYYRQNGVRHKEKINGGPSKNVKTNQPHPKPPINWMTTPDLKPETTFPAAAAPLTKDFDYSSNNFYSSSSFTRSSHAPCFNTNPPTYQAPEFQNTLNENRKPTEGNFTILPHNTLQRNEFDENQFSWSPTKLPQFFDTSHGFVSSTLPTLVGDLALGTTQPSSTNEQTKIQTDKDLSKTKDGERRSKSQSYDHPNSQSNFLSVSQLVEKQTEGVPARTTSRRNSGTRSNKNSMPHKSSRRGQKQADGKECGDRTARNYNQNKVDMAGGRRENLKMSNQRNQSLNYAPENPPSWFDYNKNQRQEPNKNPQSIYSAEALLGHQISQNNVMFRQQHSNFPPNTKSLPIPNFLSDNIMPYFSSVELQDNSFIQQNQNFQTTALAHNFSNTVQSYSYLSNNHITSASNIGSSYLPSSTFISDLNTQDYSASAQNNILSQNTAKVFGDKQPPKQNIVIPPTNDRPAMQHLGNGDCAVSSSISYAKKPKLKQSTENSLPGIVDFSFLSMPGTIGSPMLPDDFHVHTNFLPPPTPSQLYSCKNPPYPKQASELTSASMITLPPLAASRGQAQNIETPPNMNTIGNSLTNFNLSTIFPEINKGSSFPSSGTCQRSNESKEFSSQKNYFSGSAQAPFQNKSTSNYGIPVPHTKSNS